MNREVVPNHTEEDIKGYIDTGERLLKEAGYDDAERIALLPTIIGLLGSKTIYQHQPQVVEFDPRRLGGKVGL